MSPFRNRRGTSGTSRSRRVLVWGGIALFGAYLGFFLVFGRMGLFSHVRMQHEAARVDHEIQVAHQDIRALSRNVRALRDDPAAIERLARERLGMVKPDEVVYLFADRHPATAPAGADGPLPPYGSGVR